MTGPLFSVIIPVYSTPEAVLIQTIQSVLHQSFDDWEIVAVDDCSPSDGQRRILAEAASHDPRIRIVHRASNGGIVAASNDGVGRASGEFIALLDHDDVLSPDALEVMARHIRANPEVDYLYSDEDKIDASGHTFDPFRKPDWSPERLRHQMYTAHLSVLRTSLVRQVGSFRAGYDGSQDHDLVLRVTERARKVVHVPDVLYHWRVVAGSTAGDDRAKPYAWDAGRRAVQDHLDRMHIPATAGLGRYPGRYTITRDHSALPQISLIIPTRGGEGSVWGESRVFVIEAIRSALSRTSLHPEIVVVYDDATPDRVLSELRSLCGRDLVAVPFSGEFNFSAKCNAGVLASSGDIVVLMNDDVQAINDGWLEELTTPLIEPDVGMTGAKLYFSDGTLQHAGHRYHRSWSHYGYGHVDSPEVLFGAYDMNREASGVTAACAALRRDVFEEVGGLFVGLPVNFNDVDLSYKVRHVGYRIVVAARARLYHFESRTRLPTVHKWEVDAVHKRWGKPGADPYAPVQ